MYNFARAAIATAFTTACFTAHAIAPESQYSMSRSDFTADVTIKVTGDCKFNQTFKNAQFGYVTDNYDEDNSFSGALSADGELLVGLSSYAHPVAQSSKTKYNTQSASGSYAMHIAGQLTPSTIKTIMQRACGPDVEFAQFAQLNHVEQKASGSYKENSSGSTSTNKMTLKANAELYTLKPETVQSSESPNGSSFKLQSKTAKISISFSVKDLPMEL